MNEEQALRARFETKRAALDAWGRFVVEKVSHELAGRLRQAGDARSLDQGFFKVPPAARVKDTASFLAKALHRGKRYTDPLNEITDQVGVRFVVLLGTETKLVGEVVRASTEWDVAQDRDYFLAREQRPHWFEYESDHFVVRPVHEFEYAGVRISVDISCEIQVRTLLQHAYAELSHDRLYKPECEVPDSLRRLVARGSALLETTDDMFCRVSQTLADQMAVLRSAHEAAEALLKSHGVTVSSTNPQVSFALLKQWKGRPISREDMEEMLHRRDYVPSLMRARHQESLLYAHPVGLLSYFVVDQLQREASSIWPFDRALLEQLAADLGISLE